LLTTRLATAAIGIPVLVGFVFAGGWWLAILAALAVTAAAAEYLHGRGLAWDSIDLVVPALWAGALVAVAHEGGPWRERFLVLAFLTIACLVVIRGEWWRGQRELKGQLTVWEACASVLLYLGWLGGYLVLTRDLEDGREWFFLVLLVTWATDTGAYAAGRLTGRRPMSPAISPNKTWEGALGGWVTGLVVTIACWAVLDPEPLSFGHAVILGLFLPVIGQAGDLFESLLKRGMEVKDSSGLIPGHGGLLDRLDSLLWMGAAVYFYVTWVLL
jgi:phosphatidate cytidylyltransferase